ncbi:MAG: formimidoylglutamase [Cyclobacteriaceae bacterium]|nr:formimidoylglutamase [Cyclobacteriaceae bacterium]MCH8515594.1 formimidoylglutamase [Cyclobacteriaceae bacterium]
MNVSLFFDPVDESLVEKRRPANSFGSSIFIHSNRIPSLKDMDIVLIGLPFSEGNPLNLGCEAGPDKVREKLYDLYKGFGSYQIADLGNLRAGMSQKDTMERIREVCAYFIDMETLPILIGGSHDLDLAQYQAYDDMEKLITVIGIDAFLDMTQRSADDKGSSHLQRILLHEPNFLFHYSHIGHQSYLCDPDALNALEKLYFDTIRIGEIRRNIGEVEPVIRQGDMLSFDITAIKSADAPGNKRAQAFGLSGEEACQLSWYAGLSEKLSSAGFYEYNPSADDEQYKTASVVATMIWYFIEGFYHRQKDLSFKSQDILKYVVPLPEEPASLTFYKSKLSEKWWLEVPYPKNTTGFERNCIIPCSYSDYQIALTGEVPNKYVQIHSKLI